MKTVLISTFFPRSVQLEGGAAILVSLARGLAARGALTTVHAPFGEASHEGFELADYQVQGLASYPAYLRDLTERAPHHDIVILVDHSPATFLSTGRILGRHPRVVHYFGSPYQPFREILRPPYSWQYLRHWLLKNGLLARLGVRRDRLCVVGSRYQSDQLRRLGVPAELIAVVPHGVDETRCQRREQTDAREACGLPGGPLVGYLGHFSPIKGVPVLVEAFSRLLKMRPEARLALAWSGKGDEEHRVRRRIECSDLCGHVHLLNVVDPGAFFSALDVCVFPYVHSSTPHFPLAVIEAFAVGTPVVISDVGGLSELVADRTRGLIVPPHDPRSLALAIEELLASADLRSHISDQEIKYFQEHLSHGVVGERLYELL